MILSGTGSDGWYALRMTAGGTWTRRISIALLAGVAITVALSWLAMPLPRGNAWHGPKTAQDLGLWEARDGKLWSISRGRNAWHTVVSYWHMQVSGQSMMIPEADYEAQKFDFRTLPRPQGPGSLDELYMNAWYHQTGWPMPALACSVHWKQQIANSDIIYTVRGGVQLPRDTQFNPRALPMTPLWPGFLVNSALFAGLWLLLTVGTGAIRRAWRTQCGRCGGCGYPRSGLADSAACPECGGR